MLFADDTAVAAHSPSHLKSLVDRFDNACTDFKLTTSLKNNKSFSTSNSSPKITINNYELEVVEVHILRIYNKLEVSHRELDRRIGMVSKLCALEHVCGKITDYLSRPWCQCLTLVVLEHFYTEVNAGQRMLLKNVG